MSLLLAAARSQGYAAYNRHSLEHVSATVDPTAGEPIVVLSFARSPVLDRGYRKCFHEMPLGNKTSPGLIIFRWSDYLADGGYRI